MKGYAAIFLGFGTLLLISVVVYLALSAAFPTYSEQYVIDPLSKLRVAIIGR